MRGARPDRALERLVAAAPWRAGETVLVACSGGPDSVALALLAARAARARGFTPRLAHVNHALRASADADEAVVLAVAARLGLAVDVVRLAPPRDDEATLRALRYAALAALAARRGAGAVATAHTAEDQTETVLLALFRGAGLTGIAGIPPERPLADGVRLLRPLLRAGHAELLALVRAAALPAVRDPANREPRYRRVAVRDALVGLRETFPGLDRAVARAARIARDDLDGHPRAAARRALRARLAQTGEVTFERIEAALDADLVRDPLRPDDAGERRGDR